MLRKKLQLSVFVGGVLVPWFVLTMPASVAASAAGEDNAQSPLDCSEIFDRSWTASERWAWAQICQGNSADFHAVGSPADNTISSKFVTALLTEDRYRSRLTSKGIVLLNGYFPDALVLSRMHVDVQLWFDGSVFRREVEIADGTFTQLISFDGAILHGGLFGERATTGYLFMRGAHVQQPIDIIDARIGGFEASNKADFTEIDAQDVESDSINLSDSSANRVFLDDAVLRLGLNLARARIKQFSADRLSTRELQLDGLSGSSVSLEDDSLESVTGTDVNATEVSLQQAIVRRYAILTKCRVAHLNLNSLQVAGLLRLSKSTFNDVDLRGDAIGGELDITGSTVRDLNMNSVHVSGHTFLTSGNFANVDMRRAVIGGNLEMDSLNHQAWGETSTINARGVRVGQLLSLDGSSFAKLNLDNATVGDDLEITRTTISNQLSINYAQLGGRALLASNAVRNHGAILTYVNATGSLDIDNGRYSLVDLTGARIGRSLSIISTMARSASLRYIDVGSNVAVDHATIASLDASGAKIGRTFHFGATSVFPNGEVIEDAEIGSNLEIDGGRYSSIDLTGTEVKGTFRLASPIAKDRKLQWAGTNRLVLTHFTTRSLEDEEPGCLGFGTTCLDPWPRHLDLDDFVYGSLGSNQGVGTPMSSRDSKWWRGWLGRQDNAAAEQPYRQLASALRANSADVTADDVMVAGMDAQSSTQQGVVLKDLYLAYRYTIGYGFHLYYALFWAIGLVVIGAIVLRVSGEGRRLGMPFGFAYSLDMLAPLVRLRESHYKVELRNWARYYFYLHKLLGFVLATYVIATLAGLAPK